MTPNPHTVKFKSLWAGLERAYGTGEGRWVHEPVKLAQYSEHLAGRGPGLGIAPLMDDGKVWWSAIDLDMPDFDAARDMASMLPGTSWIDQSRSGNAHILCFFREPMEAWVPRGVMREATAALGLPRVEVFPKQDKLRPGMVGSYLNLNYYGDTRPALHDGDPARPMSLAEFVDGATESLNDPDEWRKKARWLMIPSPEERESARGESVPHGEQPYLHMCCEYVIENRDTNPVVEGHRAVVYFNMAKQLTHCALFDSDEALQMMMLVNDASPDPIEEAELRRILSNAERGGFVSTGCDDPLFAGIYSDPNCPIARR